MIPTQKPFYPYTTSLAHPSSFFLQNISGASSNHPLQAQLKNAFSAFPAQYNLPRFTPSYFPHMADALSLLKFQQHMQAQLSALYSAKLPKIDGGTFSSVQTPTNKFYGSPSESSTHEVKLESETSLGLPNDPDICLEAQIKYIIHFFVNNSGRITMEEMQQAKLKYAQNSKLMSIFEALASKYSVITKTREEMIKWIIRRCLKMSKKSMKKDKKDQKTVLKDLCLRYFKDSEGDSGEEEDSEMVDRVLPFRKNSKNKTMNTSFVIEIFQSEQFREDYKIFLERFDEISEKENAEKVSRFTSLVLDCAKRGNFERIAKYKRVPWLKVWISNTKRAAKELDDGDFEGKSNKRTKLAH